jgi:NitT/TauT family transport system ATP-binding protein
MHDVLQPELARNGIGVTVRHVRRDFGGGVVALDGMDLSIAPGEFVAILGPSGCGKSTLLRIIAGLDRPTSGTIELTSAALRAPVLSYFAEKQPIAYVFQDAHLLPWRDVLANVALPLELRHMPRRERIQDATRAIEAVGLTEFARKYPAQLSGGMRMRVSLARALVTDPQLLLLDEPFAALDEITRAQLDQQLRQLWIDRRMTVLFVTHSITEAAFLADRAIVMTRRPGRVVLDTPIDLGLERPDALRGEAAFARHTRTLLDALQRGGA